MSPRTWTRNLFARMLRTVGQTADRSRRVSVRLNVETLEKRLNPAPTLHTTWEGIDMRLEALIHADERQMRPADPHAAIGTTHSVAVVNTSIEIAARGGELIPIRAPLATFFGVPLNTKLFDPKVIFDRHSLRFFLVVLERDDTSVSAIRLAVSPQGDPRNFASWHKFRIDTLEIIDGQFTWADYPGFAVDRDALYITANMFTFGTTRSYKDSRLWIVNKAIMIAGGLIQTRHDPNLGFTIQPAQTYSNLPAGDGTFLVTAAGRNFLGQNLLNVTRVADPLGTPTFTTRTLNVGYIDQGILPDAPQLGSTGLVETNDNRMMNAVWHNNQLYAVNTVNPPSGPDAGQATAHWYRIDTTDLANPVLADQGNIGGEELVPGLHTFFPSVSVDDRGYMAVGFSYSMGLLYPGAAFTGRRAGHVPGYTEPFANLAIGQDWYNRPEPLPPAGLGRNRWGDYSAITLDPVFGTLFHVYNMYTGTRLLGGGYEDGLWKTRHGYIGHLTNYEIVTVGEDAITLTLDNNIPRVRLERSGLITSIFVNGVFAGATNFTTINVHAGWAGTTTLEVIHPDGGSYTLTGSQLLSPGLTVNFRNLGSFELQAGVLGGDVVVNVNGQPGIRPNSPLSIATGVGNDVVTIGNGSTPLPLRAAVNSFFGLGGNDRLILNDQGTTAAQTWTFRDGSAIQRNGADFIAYPGWETVEFHAGRGNDVLQIGDVPFGTALSVNAGFGNDTINAASPGNNLDVLRAPVTVNGQAGTDTLNINDTANTRNDAWTLTPTVVSRTGGSNPAITYGTVEALHISLNAATSTINVTGTATNTLTTINGVVVAPPTITRTLAEVTADEGSSAANTGTFDDAQGRGIVRLDASLGTMTRNDATGDWSWSYTPLDGPHGPTIVTITATDNYNLTASTTFTLTVANVAPTIAISGNASVSVGATYTLTLGTLDEPGTDTVSQYIVNWGDGNSNSYSSAGGKTHTYAVGGVTRAITVDLIDEDGTHLNRANAMNVTVQPADEVVDVTASLLLTRSGLVFNRTTGRWFQTVTIKNIGNATISGPMSLVLTNLSAGVTLANRTGKTTRRWINSSYRDVMSGSLAVGQTVSVALEFVIPSGVALAYDPRVLAGAGAR